MPAGPQNMARKRPVNLTLREDVVEEAKGVTDNLSGVVESLLVDFLARERHRKKNIAEQATATVALWNEFAARNGSFADDYSTL